MKEKMEPVQEEKRNEPVKRNKTAYTMEELVSAADIFAASPDLIRAALMVSGKNEATEEEARKIIEQFRKREV